MTNNTFAFAIISVAIASLTLVFGSLQIQTSTAAETPKGNDVYIFAEGVNPHVTFEFNGGVEASDFQAFTQTSGFTGTNGRGTQPEFTLVKVPGNTPYLYQAADELLTKGGGSVDWKYNRFDVKVDLVQAGETLRSFKYTSCEINSYRVYTDWDKEEGYTTGKTGFAVQDEFKFLCQGHKPLNPQLDQLNGVKPEYTTKSTSDLK